MDSKIATITLHLTREDGLKARRILKSLYHHETVSNLDLEFVNCLGIRLETEAKCPDNPAQADYGHRFLNSLIDKDKTGCAVCHLCDKLSEVTTRNEVNLCDNCHTQEVGEEDHVNSQM